MNGAKKHLHIAFHKPRGYSCSHNRAESPIIEERLGEKSGQAVNQSGGSVLKPDAGVLQPGKIPNPTAGPE